MTGAIVRYACDRCSRFWATEAELSGHRCVDVIEVLESRDLMLASMARVWGKVQGSERAEYKQYVEMGDILYHETNGERGACGRYDGPPCQPAEATTE